MADLIKKVKIKKQDGTYTDYIPIGVDAKNISMSDGSSIEDKLDKKPYYFNTIADMKDAKYLKNNDLVKTLGLNAINDGNGALYRIEDSKNKKYEEIKPQSLNNYSFNIFGANIWLDGTYNSTEKKNELVKTLKKMREYHMDTLLIPIQHVYDENLNITNRWNLEDSVINFIIEQAKELKFNNIIIKPHLTKTSELNPSDYVTIFRNWKTRLMELVEISLNYNLNTICFGNEMQSLSNSNLVLWQDIINTIKTYGLKTMYCYCGFEEFYKNIFYKYIDIIGINYYPPINDILENLNVEEGIIRLGESQRYEEYSSRRNFEKIKHLLNEDQKIIISEIGCQCNMDSLKYPAKYNNWDTQTFNQKIQAFYYEVFLKALCNSSLPCNGLCFWNVSDVNIQSNYYEYNCFANQKTLDVLNSFNFKTREENEIKKIDNVNINNNILDSIVSSKTFDFITYERLITNTSIKLLDLKFDKDVGYALHKSFSFEIKNLRFFYDSGKKFTSDDVILDLHFISNKYNTEAPFMYNYYYKRKSVFLSNLPKITICIDESPTKYSVKVYITATRNYSIFAIKILNILSQEDLKYIYNDITQYTSINDTIVEEITEESYNQITNSIIPKYGNRYSLGDNEHSFKSIYLTQFLKPPVRNKTQCIALSQDSNNSIMTMFCNTNKKIVTFYNNKWYDALGNDITNEMNTN